jgi:hypothetical protein
MFMTIAFELLYATNLDTFGYRVHCGVKLEREEPQA